MEIRQPKTQTIPKDSIHMSIEEFMNGIIDGIYTDENGHGFHATKYVMFDFEVIPSKVMKGEFEKNISCVVWIPNKNTF